MINFKNVRLDYDEYYDTKISRSYGTSKFGWITALFISLTGVLQIILTIVDLQNTNLNAGPQSKVYYWDENPIWATYGKGFWVGLIMIVTGILGFVSARELTISSIYGYVIHCVTCSVLNFYLVVSCCIPLAKYAWILGSLANYYVNSFTVNVLLLGLSSAGFVLTSFTAVGAAYYSGLLKERRGYGGVFIESYYKSKPANVVF